MATQEASNPAESLLTILQRFNSITGGVEGVNSSYDTVWAQAFGVDPNVVTSFVADALSLIPAIERSLGVRGSNRQMATFALHNRAWSRPFLPEASGRGQTPMSGIGVHAAAVAALGSIAEHLNETGRSEGPVISPQSAADLRDEISAVEQLVRNSTTLPPQVRDVLLARLVDMLWAFDRITISGTDAVVAACDRLSMAFMSAIAQTGTTLQEAQAAVAPNQPEQPDEVATPAGILARVAQVIRRVDEVAKRTTAWSGAGAILIEAGIHAGTVARAIGM